MTTGGLAYDADAAAADAAHQLQVQLDELRAQLHELAEVTLSDAQR